MSVLFKRTFGISLGIVLLLLIAPSVGLCSPGEFDGETLGIYWVIPFICMLLSIALCPVLMPHIWESHFGKISVFWGAAFLVPCGIAFGASEAWYEFLHSMLLEYLPFILLLLALFTVAGGIRLKGSLVGTPKVNALILLVGTLLASWMGTTGAAMLLIRPILQANSHRKYKVHTVIFFIFLVANIGGVLTPLGDPPLFMGFLQGIDFFWTLIHLFPAFIFMTVCLFVIYIIVDTILYKKEGSPKKENTSNEKLGLEGRINILLLLAVVAAVFASGVWKPGVSFNVYRDISLDLQGIGRDVLLLVITFASLALTSKAVRVRNDFSWGPIKEVAKLFLGIFLSMIPALAILKAGDKGALASLINLVSTDGVPHNGMYFWLSGTLSSFLDNTPTYLVLFNTVGGTLPEGVDVAKYLMTDMSRTLMAISMGAVFMGANTYIGNAPNFMVRSIAESSGVKMPSFFGYMLWSVCILIPLFIISTFIFFV